ncbi:MAG: MgtC/SapB family protein [Actinobacteria bacterium]|nr:MgtC/SapB family protein [Actinomycetota bacterium]
MSPHVTALTLPYGERLPEFGNLLFAFVLSSLIGLERQVRQKSAGLRTHALVGVGAALFMEISKFGFYDLLAPGRVVLDPSRVAAQIVTGIGFIGGGLIFVRRDAVRGLTTAAVVWVTCAVGMACGAGLVLLAVAVTAGHFVTIFVYTPLSRRIGRARPETWEVRLAYHTGLGILPQVLAACTSRGYEIVDVRVTEDREEPGGDLDDRLSYQPGEIEAGALLQRQLFVTLRLRGTAPVHDLVAELSELVGVRAATGGDVSEPVE